MKTEKKRALFYEVNKYNQPNYDEFSKLVKLIIYDLNSNESGAVCFELENPESYQNHLQEIVNEFKQEVDENKNELEFKYYYQPIIEELEEKHEKKKDLLNNTLDQFKRNNLDVDQDKYIAPLAQVLETQKGFINEAKAYIQRSIDEENQADRPSQLNSSTLHFNLQKNEVIILFWMLWNTNMLEFRYKKDFLGFLQNHCYYNNNGSYNRISNVNPLLSDFKHQPQKSNPKYPKEDVIKILEKFLNKFKATEYPSDE